MLPANWKSLSPEAIAGLEVVDAEECAECKGRCCEVQSLAVTFHDWFRRPALAEIQTVLRIMGWYHIPVEIKSYDELTHELTVQLYCPLHYRGKCPVSLRPTSCRVFPMNTVVLSDSEFEDYKYCSLAVRLRKELHNNTQKGR